MLCAIWYHLYHLQNVKNIHGGVLLCKVAGFTSLNCANGTKSYKQSQIQFLKQVVNRSRRPELLGKKCVKKNFSKLIEKHQFL